MSPPANPQRRSRVLFIINSLAGGGAERVMATLLANSGPWRERYHIALAVLDADVPAFALPQWLKVFQLDCRGSTLPSMRGVDRVVARFRPDIAVSFLTRANMACGWAMGRRRRPWIISERTSTAAHLGGPARQAVTRALMRLMYPRASAVIAVSEGVAGKLSSRSGVKRSRIEVLPNPVDVAGLKSAAHVPERLDLGVPYTIALGRLVSVKNYQLLIRAFARSGLDGLLVIAGEGPERLRLQAVADELGIRDRVIMPGWLVNPYPALANARCFALSSNVEGFPNALVEALALGVPCVATDCPCGPAEILAGGSIQGSRVTVADAGVLAPPGDVERFAQALRLASEEPLRCKLAAAGPKRARGYSVEAIAARYWALIERTLEPSADRPAA